MSSSFIKQLWQAALHANVGFGTLGIEGRF
jgi:hypothetical protein